MQDSKKISSSEPCAQVSLRVPTPSNPTPIRLDRNDSVTMASSLPPFNDDPILEQRSSGPTEIIPYHPASPTHLPFVDSLESLKESDNTDSSSVILTSKYNLLYFFQYLD